MGLGSYQSAPIATLFRASYGSRYPVWKVSAPFFGNRSSRSLPIIHFLNQSDVTQTLALHAPLPLTPTVFPGACFP